MNDLYAVIILAILALNTVQKTKAGLGDVMGWIGGSLFLYCIPKAVAVIALMAFTETGVVIPVPDDPWIHIPSMIFATLTVGAIYIWAWRKRLRREAHAIQSNARSQSVS